MWPLSLLAWQASVINLIYDTDGHEWKGEKEIDPTRSADCLRPKAATQATNPMLCHATQSRTYAGPGAGCRPAGRLT